MNQEIIIITGLGRCGTSLAMQMLSAAGIVCAGEHPSYEPDEMLADPPREFIELFEGGAIKFLDPHRINLPEGHAYRFIFLTRSRRQQSLSQVKWLTALGEAPRFASMDAEHWQRKLASDETVALTKLRKHGCPITRIRFEDLIERTESTVYGMVEFLGIDAAHVPAMVSQVLPRPHGAQNYPGLLEMKLMEQVMKEVES